MVCQSTAKTGSLENFQLYGITCTSIPSSSVQRLYFWVKSHLCVWFFLQAVINPDWQDMFVLIQSNQELNRSHQGFSAVYRKPQEGRVPEQERQITANVEADQQHIETIVNFACSFMWASILDTTPPQPHINLL